MPSIIALVSLLLLASAALTSVVVLTTKPLTIRTHREVGELSSSVDTLYLKGARERSETRVEKPSSASNTIHVGIASAIRSRVLLSIRQPRCMRAFRSRTGQSG